jgi:hypothetical protein
VPFLCPAPDKELRARRIAQAQRRAYTPGIASSDPNMSCILCSSD